MARPARAPSAPQAFRGFGPDCRAFFRELDANQSRDWFAANKDRYAREVQEPMGRLVVALGMALAGHDVPLIGDPKTAQFRIHRDIRFSKDKRPYKTHAGAVLTRDGTKQAQGLLYVQVGSDKAFAALGFYAPEPADLMALRTRIAAQQDRWRGVAAALAKKGLALSREGAAARLPRGFEPAAVEAVADVLRLKSLIVTLPLSDADIASSDLVPKLAAFASAGLPLLDFGWTALAERPRG